MHRRHAWAVLGCAVALALLSPRPGQALAVLQAPDSDPSTVVGAAAAVLAWLLLGWLTLTVLLTLGSRAHGVVGVLSARLLRRAAPATLRRVVAVALGVGIVVGTGGVAQAAGSGPTGGPGPAATVGLAVTAGLAATGTASPSLDWPSAGTPVPADPVGGPADPTTPAPVDDPSGPGPEVPVPGAGTPTPAPPARPAAAPAGPAAPSPAGEVVVVAPGDTLWSVAAAHLPAGAPAAAVAQAWPTWWAANRAVIGDDPDLLHVGEVLHAPSG